MVPQTELRVSFLSLKFPFPSSPGRGGEGKDFGPFREVPREFPLSDDGQTKFEIKSSPRVTINRKKATFIILSTSTRPSRQAPSCRPYMYSSSYIVCATLHVQMCVHGRTNSLHNETNQIIFYVMHNKSTPI